MRSNITYDFARKTAIDSVLMTLLKLDYFDYSVLIKSINPQFLGKSWVWVK